MEPITLNVNFFKWYKKWFFLLSLILNNIKHKQYQILRWGQFISIWTEGMAKYYKHIFHRIKFIHDIYILVCVSDSWYFIAFFSLCYYFFSKRWQFIVEISMDDSWYFVSMIFSPF